MSLKTLGQLNSPDKLVIFERFKVDLNLPKHKKNEDGSANESSSKKASRFQGESWVSEESGDNLTVSNGSWLVNGAWVANPSVTPIVGDTSLETPWYKRLFKRTPKRHTVTPEITTPTPVQYVFDLVLKNPEELKVFEDRNLAFEKSIEAAKLAGQGTLVKQLLAEKEVRKFENALVATGRKRYLSEAQLLRFVKGCEKGLCLDWVADFVRIIPSEVVQAKVACDALELFDNYVVLHYDPDNKGTTEEARAKARDPILFGVMKGSRKLYFVGDWIDELCDLTFSQIVDKLAEGPLEIK